MGDARKAPARTSTPRGATSPRSGRAGQGKADARARRTAVRFRCELLVAAARVRQEPQPGRSLNRTIRKSIAQAIEHWADTVDTIDDKQIAEFDAAALGIGDDEFRECMHRATFEGWEGRTAETASEFIAIVIRRLKSRHRH
jgi:hypothetical protein